MDKSLVRNLLRKNADGLSFYSIYIKLRFSLSIDALKDVLSDRKYFVKINNKYISREIDEVSAYFTFYINYYKTKDIITIYTLLLRRTDDKELDKSELNENIVFINTPEGFVKKENIPDKLWKYYDNTNTVVSIYNFPGLFIREIPELEKWGYLNLDRTLREIDIKDESVIPAFYVDYEAKSSMLYLYPKFIIGKELIDFEEVENVSTGSFIRKNNSWRRLSYGDRERFSPVIKNLGLTEDESSKKIKRYKLENFKFTLIEEYESYYIEQSQRGALQPFNFIYSERAKDFIYKLSDFNSIAEINAPLPVKKAFDKENIKLRAYQKLGINWLNYLRESGLNALIADDMGLGKTIQVITALAHSYEDDETEKDLKPSLVICPKSVLGVWKEQLSRFYPSIRIGEVMGKKSIDEYLKSATSTNKIILLTTYETVNYRKDSFLKYEFLYLILDEAQKIKNHNTQMSRSIKKIEARHKIAMTGTPIENHLSELWSIFDFIMKGYLGTHEQFKLKFRKPISNGNNSVMRLLKKKIDPFKIRRTKKQKDANTGKSIIELPELISDDIKIELNPIQMKLYRKILNSQETRNLKTKLEKGEKLGSLKLNIFAILTRLKQICDHPLLLPEEFFTEFKNKPSLKKSVSKSEKFEIFKEKIDEIIESEQKVVVFSQYKEMLGIMEDYFNQVNIGYSKLVGGMSQKSREDNINQFQKDKNNHYPVFLASLKAGGVGISLTSASNVIHYDRWWNPAVENQATDRVYRSGNTSTIVNIYKLISSNTIEDKIDKIMKNKKALLETIVKEDDISVSKTFTREELIGLLTE